MTFATFFFGLAAIGSAVSAWCWWMSVQHVDQWLKEATTAMGHMNRYSYKAAFAAMAAAVFAALALFLKAGGY